MKTVSIHEAKTHFSKLVNQALQGEDIIIARGGKPLLRLVPYTASENATVRRGGQLRDILQIREDFDAPLPDDFWVGTP